MKVLVVGGGMAGLTYAIISARNGNQVVLCERNARVGKKISATSICWNRKKLYTGIYQ